MTGSGRFRALGVLCMVVAGALALAQPAPESMNSGIVYGENYAFVLSAPAGWVLDNESGAKQGLDAVFYPEGSSWRESGAVMYANVVQKTEDRDSTLAKVLASDEARFRSDSPGLVIQTAAAVATGDGKQAVIRHFSGSSLGNWEAVAYIDEEKVVSMLVLSCREEALFKKSLPSFEKLVASYRFLTERVRVSPAPEKQ
jgi:hypothetical protein